eukprot:SAG25_NODE_947_length_4626_cov_2.304838_3_plen_154_part_00
MASGLTIRRPAVGRPPPCETSPEASRRRRGGGRRQPSRPSDHTCFRNTNSALVTDLKKNEASAVRKNCAPDAPADGDKRPVTRWPQDRWTELHGLSYMDVYGAKCSPEFGTATSVIMGVKKAAGGICAACTSSRHMQPADGKTATETANLRQW